jgi:hypothetical protein
MSFVKYIIVDSTSSCMTSVPKRTVTLMKDDGKTSETVYLPMSGIRELLQSHPRAQFLSEEQYYKLRHK